MVLLYFSVDYMLQPIYIIMRPLLLCLKPTLDIQHSKHNRASCLGRRFVLVANDLTSYRYHGAPPISTAR